MHAVLGPDSPTFRNAAQLIAAVHARIEAFAKTVGRALPHALHLLERHAHDFALALVANVELAGVRAASGLYQDGAMVNGDRTFVGAFSNMAAIPDMFTLTAAAGTIDAVFLTGGSSLIPSVRQLFARSAPTRSM